MEGYVAEQLVRRVGIVGLSLSDRFLVGFNLQCSLLSCRKEYLGGGHKWDESEFNLWEFGDCNYGKS